MIFTLILISALLALIHYLGLEAFIMYGINLPIYYYLGLCSFLMVLRLILAVYKYLPLTRRLVRSLVRFVEASETSGPNGVKSNGPRSGGLNNRKRMFSTSSKSRDAGNISLDTRLSPKPIKLGSKRVTDNFFRVIAKRGTLVSLLRGKARKGIPTLANLFSKVGFRIFGAVFTAKGKYLSRIRQLNAFRVHLDIMSRRHGHVYVVKYLKASQLAIQKSLAGTPVSSLNQLDADLPYPRLSNTGLPKWIPVRDRRLILINGSGSVIRWWLTLYSVYRVISIPGKLKLNTITDSLTVPISNIEQVAQELIQLIPKSKFVFSEVGDRVSNAYAVNRPGIQAVPLLEAASSTAKVSWLGLISDIDALARAGQLTTLLNFLLQTKQTVLLRLALTIRDSLKECKNMLPITGDAYYALFGDLPVGKLSLKKEAAGKVRVFAMVTVWDQAVLRPIHNGLFGWLKTVINDGTFDQNASVRRCMTKVALTGKSFGYDLTAATDRLPLKMQIAIINALLPGLGELWAALLVNREYGLNGHKEFPEATGKYKYSVGQPMGALSSWAMLAVTHHMLAQDAAWRARLAAGPDFHDPHGFWKDGWYSGYEVLGDDIVFFEENVAHEYLALMEFIGVPINLSKSVISKNKTFEFAKVTGHNGMHVAAVSWAMFMAQPTAMGRAGIAFALLAKRIPHKGVIKYLTTLSRESKYTAGSPNLLMLTIGTMFSNKGLFRLKELYNTFVEVTNGRLSIFDALNQNANYTALTQAIAELYHEGKAVTIRLASSRYVAMNADAFALKQGLAKTIISYAWGSTALNPEKDAKVLAKTLITMLLAFSPEGQKILLDQLESEGAFSLRPGVYARLSPVGKLVHPVYCLLFQQQYEKLVLVWDKLHAVKSESKLRSLELEDLMKLLDEVDRYREIIDLPQRTQDKLAKVETPSRNLIESPLDVLKRIMRSDKEIETMRQVVVSTGIELITKMFARNDSSALRAMLLNYSNEEETDYGLKRPAGPPPLAAIKALIQEKGESFVLTHLPKWGQYAAAMFGKPQDGPPEKLPWTPLMAQPDYLYAIGYLVYLNGKEYIPQINEGVPFEDDPSSSEGEKPSETASISSPGRESGIVSEALHSLMLELTNKLDFLE